MISGMDSTHRSFQPAFKACAYNWQFVLQSIYSYVSVTNKKFILCSLVRNILSFFIHIFVICPLKYRIKLSSLKLPEIYETCLRVSSLVKGKYLSTPPSGGELATL